MAHKVCWHPMSIILIYWSINYVVYKLFECRNSIVDAGLILSNFSILANDVFSIYFSESICFEFFINLTIITIMRVDKESIPKEQFMLIDKNIPEEITCMQKEFYQKGVL